MVNLEMAFGNLLLFVFVILEICILKFYLKKDIPWKELILNLNSGHILLWIFRGLEVAAYYYTVTHFSTNLTTTLPYWLLWLLAFILWDLMFYWLHRTHHFFKLLWSIHVVHHEGEHYSLSLGIRNSWYSSITSFPYFVIMAVIGFPIEVFISVSSIHYFIQFYNHNHLINKSGWLEYIIVTPAHHRVHHGKNDPYIDKNFGGTFVFWDKLFGTFQSELVDNPVVFGTNDPVKSHNPILVNTIPFIKLIKPYEKNSIESNPNIIPNFILISSALFLFTQLLFFIYFENILSPFYKSLLFSMIFIGTIGTGILSDGKSTIGLIIYSISGIIIPLFLMIYFPILHILFSILLLLTIFNGLLTCIWYYTFKNKSLEKQ
jgi:sterol desaturase/sphingolipid hydroxylase (fatty acid hydroxylase superfamily)